MINFKPRLARLEANQPPEPSRLQATFLLASDANNEAMVAAESRAMALGQDFMVIELLSPELDADGRAICRQDQ